ncbi:hypothetical protein F7F69_28840, partial [Escherichia coli]
DSAALYCVAKIFPDGENILIYKVNIINASSKKDVFFMKAQHQQAFTPHPALCASNLKLPRCSGVFYPLLDIFSTEQSLARKVESV